MTEVVAHVSDLHFGAHDPRLAEALLDDLNTLRPALVAISGDFTQRARNAQFEAAHRWLMRLEAPHLAVPGNHDLPVYDVVTRLLAPRARYRTYVSAEREPWFADGVIAVCGIDTTSKSRAKHGRITSLQAHEAARRFAAHPRSWRIVVAHHPLLACPALDHDRAAGAQQAIPVLEDACVDIVLTGHRHKALSESCTEQNPAHTMIAVHAGTCISTRLRGEPNSYNQLRFDGEVVTITDCQWDGHTFVEDSAKSYRRDITRACVR